MYDIAYKIGPFFLLIFKIQSELQIYLINDLI